MTTHTDRDLRTFGLHVAVASLTFCASLALVVGASFLIPALIGLESSQGVPHAMEAHARRILEIHEGFWPVVMACMFGVALASWYLFRRMSGPYVRFRRVFEQVAEGTIPGPVELRRLDYLHRDARAINEMNVALRTRMRGLHERAENLLELLECLSERPDLAELAAEIERGLVDAKQIEAEARGLAEGPTDRPQAG